MQLAIRSNICTIGACWNSWRRRSTRPLAADGATLAEAYRLYDRLAARLARCVGEFDRAGLWDLDDATSMPAWLRANAGRAPGDAARIVRVARVTAHLPVTAAAAADGVLTDAQVEVITATSATTSNASPATRPRWCRCWRTATWPARSRRCGRWRAAADDADPAPEPDEPDQSLHVSDVAGRGAIRATSAPETVGGVREALAVADPAT